MEKRLGIAQLCLLLAVLVFMALTRGSRGEPVRSDLGPRSRTTSMREWGKRHLSLSGDWVNRFKNSSQNSEGGGDPRDRDVVDISLQSEGGCRSYNLLYAIWGR